ncbi:hypothetical protein PS682_05594 [Pseudomonas fluorescens]|nr:hypothetical protein PS682_05594 [Pseudomonas fluorescens]
MDLAVAGAKLHLHGDGLALALGGLDQLRALLWVAPQAQVQGSAADGMGQRPTEEHFEILVGFADQTVGLAGQQDHVGAQVKQGGEALFGVAEGVLPFALASGLADHPDHATPPGFIGGEAAIDLQPVVGAVRPLDMVMHGLFERLPRQNGVKGAHHTGAVLGRQQVEVVQVLG